eukprot:4385996-Amphidinium_carterae.1
MTEWLTQVFALLDGFVTATVKQLVKNEDDDDDDDDDEDDDEDDEEQAATPEMKTEEGKSSKDGAGEYAEVQVHGRRALEELWARMGKEVKEPDRWKPFGVWRHLLTDEMKEQVDTGLKNALGMSVDKFLAP